MGKLLLYQKNARMLTFILQYKAEVIKRDLTFARQIQSVCRYFLNYCSESTRAGIVLGH